MRDVSGEMGVNINKYIVCDIKFSKNNYIRFLMENKNAYFYITEIKMSVILK